jgi:hypothetical protein
MRPRSLLYFANLEIQPVWDKPKVRRSSRRAHDISVKQFVYRSIHSFPKLRNEIHVLHPLVNVAQKGSFHPLFLNLKITLREIAHLAALLTLPYQNNLLLCVTNGRANAL